MFRMLLIVLLVRESSQKHLNIKGPVHQDLAITCLLKLFDETFKPRKLITFLQEPTLDTPGYEIQNRLIKELNLQLNWTFEVTNGERNNFESFRVCLNCNNNTQQKIYKNYFQPLMKSQYYVVILENIETLAYLMDKITTMKPYRHRGYYLVYYYPIIKDFRNIALDILKLMYEKQHYNTMVLIPTKADRFYLYGYDLYSEETTVCATTPEMVLINYCSNGTYLTNKYTMRRKYNNLRNCAVNTLAMKLPPFVISETEGLEIKILQTLAERLNITFNITMSHRAEDWGTKYNGTWDGLLKDVKGNPFLLGVGCISLDQDRVDDFDYTIDYFVERMVWILPTAAQVPHWKVIIVIFEGEVWFALISLCITFGVIFYVISHNHPNEMHFIKDFGASMLLSLQSLIGAPAMNHPKTKSMRILFIHLTLVGIVIGCVYQSCLVDVLTNPRYEFQIQTEEEIFESHYNIGGILAYRETFNETADNRSLKIYDNYQVIEEANDTMYYWLQKVAKDRDIITILGKYYVDYLISNSDPVIVDHDGHPKIFIVEEILFHFPIRLIFPKSFPLRDAFNTIIDGLLHSGLVEKWAREYLFINKREDDDEEENPEHDKRLTVITIEHVQGAFTMLMMGCAIATFIFIVEIIVSKHFNYKMILNVVLVKFNEMFRGKTKQENVKNEKGPSGRKQRKNRNLEISRNIYEEDSNIFKRLFRSLSKMFVGFKNRFSGKIAAPDIIVGRRGNGFQGETFGESRVAPSRRFSLNRVEKGKPGKLRRKQFVN